jgi:hypothetical protein
MTRDTTEKPEKPGKAYGETYVRRQERTCFGILWFASEEEADRAAAAVAAANLRYVGGFSDGARCGRAPSWDYLTPKGQPRYAVTD